MVMSNVRAGPGRWDAGMGGVEGLWLCAPWLLRAEDTGSAHAGGWSLHLRCSNLNLGVAAFQGMERSVRSGAPHLESGEQSEAPLSYTLG